MTTLAGLNLRLERECVPCGSRCVSAWRCQRRPIAAAFAAAVTFGVCCAPAAHARGYELVSPVDKNGVDVQNVLKLTPDGQGVAWVSLGAYGDAPGANAEVAYVARRGARGWETSSISPRLTDTNRTGLDYGAPTTSRRTSFGGDSHRRSARSARRGFVQPGLRTLREDWTSTNSQAEVTAGWVSHGVGGACQMGNTTPRSLVHRTTEARSSSRRSNRSPTRCPAGVPRA